MQTHGVNEAALRVETERSPQQSQPQPGCKAVGVVAALALLGPVGIGYRPIADATATPSPSRQVRPVDARRLSSQAVRAGRLSPEAQPPLDRTGRRQLGKASIYAPMFAGREMADGTRMRPTSNNAASRTLPLGTTATVTNLETGKTAVVTIQDRGPYVAGRIVDLSPATAHDIGLDRRTGITRVAVAPIAIPMPNGNIKHGDGFVATSYRVGGDQQGVGSRLEPGA
jgi:rare lipoprotein A